MRLTRVSHSPSSPRTADLPVPELVVQSGHTHAVREAVFSPDGVLLASCANDGVVKIWDVSRGREIRTLLGAVGPLYAVAFHPEGRLVASGGVDRQIRIWDVDTGRLVQSLSGHQHSIECIAFSADGEKLLSAGKDKMAVVWNLSDGSIALVLEHEKSVYDLAIDRQGNHIATHDAQGVHVWDGASGAALHTFVLPGNGSGRLEFTPDGERLVAVDGKNTAILKLASFESDRTLAGQYLGRRPSDGAWAMLIEVGRVEFLDPISGDSLARIVTTDAPAEDDVRAAHENESPLALDFKRWDAPSETAHLSPDGALLAGPTERATIGVWDAKTGGRVERLGGRVELAYGQQYGNLCRPLTIAWNPRSPQFATGGLDGLVRVIDLSKSAVPRVFDGHRSRVNALAFSPTGRALATAGMDGHLKLWNLADGALLADSRLDAELGDVEALAFSPDGLRLVSGHFGTQEGDGGLVLWDAEQLTAQRKLVDEGPRRVHRGLISPVGSKISSVAFSPDGLRLISALHEGARLSLWDAASGLHLSSTVPPADMLTSLAYSPDGSRIATAGGVPKEMEDAWQGKSESPVFVLVAATLKPLLRLGRERGAIDAIAEDLLTHEHVVDAVAYHNDGGLIATGSADTTAKLWNADDGRLIATLEGHTAEIGSLAFSHDGRFLATAGYDQSVRLWDVAKRAPAAVFLAFDSDNYLLATPDNYYTASRPGLKAAAFRLGRRAVPFEQFDLRLNRPDIVLERFGYASAERVALYRRSYEKRLRRMRVDPATMADEYELPIVQLLERPPVSTSQRQLSVTLSVESPTGALDRVLAFINDVPVWGANGMSLRDQTVTSAQLEIDLELAAGPNKVQLAVLDQRGTESLRETFDVVYQAPAPKPKLRVLAVGVSNYVDDRLDLEYAAKDARDLATLFSNEKNHFEAVEVRSLLDSDATRENIMAAKRFLEGSSVDDEAIVFFAGHGFLNKHRDYYFGTHDVDPQNPERRGLSYEALEDLLDGIPARRKLLLVDTCHSGEVDADPAIESSPLDRQLIPATVPKLAANVHEVRSFRGLELDDESTYTRVDTRGLLAELFADLRRGSGAMVISSAGGAEFAQESDKWRNGVFTFAVLEGLRDRSADLNHDGLVRVSELREYVVGRVRDLTGGRQTPTSRRENLEVDFPVD